MWDLQIANPFGRLSQRKFFLFVTMLLATVFSALLFTTSSVGAADVTWQQGSMVYEGNTYRGPTEPTEDHDLPTGTPIYTFVENPGLPLATVRVIYFPANSDPSTAAEASFVTYSQGPGGGLTNKSSVQAITIDTTTSAEANQSNAQDTSTCKVDGIGWIVCPVIKVMSVGMDWVFSALSGFVEVRPLETTSNSTMMRMWEIMRNFANVAFVIAFLVLVYSQLTSYGLTNYGIKKMMPRLIIAAILVNISYWICAAAIDISNILGYSFQNLFLGMRDSVLDSPANGWQLTSWESVAGFVLAGGAAGGAAIAGVTTVALTAGAFSATAVALLLAPILVGAFITVLIVLFIFAARQALITILVILSPLALVAYLLPNTEKWFEKWRSLFMTMLIFFPAFSLVFGGAQFAGLAIIQNAQDINTLLLGMAVQIAPLAITPLLLKLSGSLISRFAGVINNPGRGIKDRTANWSRDRLASNKSMQDAKSRKMEADGTLRGRHAIRRRSLNLDTRKRLREGRKAIDDTDINTRFANSDAGRALNESQYKSNHQKEEVEILVKRDLLVKVNTEGSELHAENVDLENLKTQLKFQESIGEKQMSNYRTEGYLKDHLNPNLSSETVESIAGMKLFEDKIARQGLAAQSAKGLRSREYASALNASELFRAEAAGIDNDKGRGEIRILSEVKSQLENEKDTLVKNIKIANEIPPGRADLLGKEFEKAVDQNNAEGMRAYADLLVEAANPGVVELRRVLQVKEARMKQADEKGGHPTISDIKTHINSSPAINAAAEDIATWSRDKDGRSLDQVTLDKKTWEGLTAQSFSGMKKSSQEAALYADAITVDTARSIKKGPVYQQLKPDMRERINRLAEGRSDYKDAFTDANGTGYDAIKNPFSEKPTDDNADI